MLEELLDDVVAEHVGHQRVGAGQDLLEDQLLLGRRRPLQLLLDEPRPVLILRKFNDVVSQVGQLDVGVSVVPRENDEKNQRLGLFCFHSQRDNQKALSSGAILLLLKGSHDHGKLAGAV